MKWSFLLFSSLICLQAFAQYPATGNKARLGWQTTGDGLVYRGAIGDTTTLDPSGINNAWMLLDTASGNLYAYRAKAWRLVSGGGGLVSDTLTGEVKGPLDSTYVDTVANINFNIALDTTAGVGELKYSDTRGSLIQGLKGGNVTNIIGQQLHQRVLNNTGGALTKGTAVILYGSQGNRITVAKALATSDSTSANTFGIVAESIADGQSGYVITEGLIGELNTSALTEGAAVWLSPTVAGGLTTTKPQAPDHEVYIGVCVKQNNGSGELFVKIRNGQELEELHDVRITSPVSNASLYYNASEDIWRDTTGAVYTSDTSVFARDFQISGTTNYLAKFTGSNAVGNSQLFDNGTNVGLSNTSPISSNGGGLTIGSSSTGKGLHLYTSGSGLFMYPSGSSNPSFQMGSSDADSSILYYNYFNYSHKFFTTNVERFRISHTGNVGIATTSPSRPLHVNATSAIRIPVGNFSQRGTSDNGDIRVRTDTASMEYYSGAWRTVAPMARVPQSGLANRFAKFDADGLLDTSAVLVQANGRIGIWNSPAAGDSVLTVTGGSSFSGGVNARNYTFASSATGNRPVLGMYSRVANRISFATNDTLRFEILATGTATLNAAVTSPTAPAFALTVNGGGIQARNYFNLNGDSLANSAPQITVANTDVGASGGYVVFQKRRGGSGAVQDGDEVGTFSWGAKINATGGIFASAGFRANVVGTVTDTFAPVDFTIFTSPRSDGSASRVPVKTDRLTIKPSGRVGIGTSTPQNILDVEGGMAIGSSYSGTNTAPTNGLLVQGETYIGTTTDNGSYNLQVGGNIKATGNISRKSAIVTTSNYTVLDDDTWITCVGAGRITLTLPSASTWPGREIVVQTGTAFGVVSNSSNVHETSSAYSFGDTSIIKADYPYAWVKLVSDGTGWIKIQRSPYIITKSVTLDFPAVAAQSSYTFSNTFVGGASIGDVVSIGVPSGMPANTIFTGQVSTTDGVVDIKMHNYGTTTTANPAAATFKIAITKF